MKSPLLYIVEMLFCSGILLAFYRLVLVRRVSFRVCRLYLVAALLLSAVIPALEIPVYPASVRNPDSVRSEWLQEAYPAGPAAVGEAAGEAVSGTQPRPATPRYALPLRLLPAAACAAVTLLSLGLLVVRLYRIRRLRRRSRLTPCAGYTLAENPQVAAPFSFLRTVFLGPGYEGERRAMVLCHEAGHVRHLHSVECLIVEFVRSLFWFNPFVWIAQRWLKEVHEWEAGVPSTQTESRPMRISRFRGSSPDEVRATAGGSGSRAVKLQSRTNPASTGRAAPSRRAAWRRLLHRVIMANRFLVSEWFNPQAISGL